MMTTKTATRDYGQTNWLMLFVVVALTVGLGALSGWLGGSYMGYSGLTRPPLTPPDVVFAVVWPILYLMMGLSFYRILNLPVYTEAEKRNRALSITLFVLQLAFNLTWSVIFFRARMFMLAYIWLIVILALTTALTVLNFKLDKWAAILLIPYVLWLCFAGYLSLFIALYN